MRCLRLCRHLLTSSLLLFSRSLLMRMWYFSSKQSLHLSEDPLYGVALSMMPQDKSYSSFFSFKCQMCLLSSVAFFRLLFLKDCLWPYNRFLNVPSVSPTYFFISCPNFIVAWNDPWQSHWFNTFAFIYPFCDQGISQKWYHTCYVMSPCFGWSCLVIIPKIAHCLSICVIKFSLWLSFESAELNT